MALGRLQTTMAVGATVVASVVVLLACGVAAVEVEVGVSAHAQMGVGVMTATSSLSGLYGRAEAETASQASPKPVPTGPKPAPAGSALANLVLSSDPAIANSMQEFWGCCRMCDDMDSLVQKIPPALEPEYGHTIREKRRHVAPERGFQEFLPPLVSCCPICPYPVKREPDAPRPPSFRGDMDLFMSSYARGDGPKDQEVLDGAAENERVTEFAKFDAPNYHPPNPDMLKAAKDRENVRIARREAEINLKYARKYLRSYDIRVAEDRLHDLFNFAELDADAQVPQYVDEQDVDHGQQRDDMEDDMSDDGSDHMRLAQQYADLDADAAAGKFGLGAALGSAAKAAVKAVAKDAGKALLNKAGQKLANAVGTDLSKLAQGAAAAAKLVSTGGRDLTRLGNELAAGGLSGAVEGAAKALGGAVGAGAAGAGAALERVGDAAEKAVEELGESEEEKAKAEEAEEEGEKKELTAEEKKELAEEEAREKQRQHEHRIAGGVPNVRRAAKPMPAFIPPAKPHNPLKDLYGHDQHYNLVGYPELKYDEFGAGHVIARKLSKAPRPYLPPCCNLCGVNSGPRLTQPERYSSCCYYCVRKDYGARPQKKRIRHSTRPLPKAPITMASLQAEKLKQAAAAQDDQADIFSPRPPMLHVNRNRFG